jgi:hypothetical protein
LKHSRKTMQQRLAGLREQLQELASLRGKNRDVVQALLSKVAADRKIYEESVRTYTRSNQKILQLGEALMQQLSLQHLDEMLERSKAEIGDSWTTHGLNLSMKALIRQTLEMAEAITRQGLEIKDIGAELYHLFHSRHGFEARTPPVLDMTRFHHSMKTLEITAEAFCNDPVNVMTEKHFLVRKFFFSLVAQARAQFEVAQRDTKLWLKGLLAPLKLQIAEHKAQLDKRTESLMRVHENLESLQKTMAELEEQHAVLQGQSAAPDQILLKLMKAAQQPGSPPPAHSGRTGDPASGAPAVAA